MSYAVLDTPSSTATSFTDLGLRPKITSALAQRGVTAPFPIQTATIPDALAGRDILGQGRTGSGKTLSFGLPMLHRLSGGATTAKRPRGIVLAPTRELALQIADALEPYANRQGLQLKVVCGGTSMVRQIAALKNSVDILIATPGRLRDLIEKRACRLDAVEIAVLDEADQMADLGFLPEMRLLLDQMPRSGQRMLFSATLDRGVSDLACEYLTDPARHSVDPSEGVVETMVHHRILVQPGDKDKLAAILASVHDRVIVFVRTQLGADRVAENMRGYGANARALHGGMAQEARTRTLAELRDGTISVLAATDVAARGIDVTGIDLVLNVDPAGGATDYLHRAGRTARAGRSGVVVTLVLPHQRRTATKLFAAGGVRVHEHEARGVFTPALAELTGVTSDRGIDTAIAHIAVRQAEREVVALGQRLAQAQRRVIDLRAAAETAEKTPLPRALRSHDRQGGRTRHGRTDESKRNSATSNRSRSKHHGEGRRKEGRPSRRFTKRDSGGSTRRGHSTRIRSHSS